MTKNQIEYAKLSETMRANRVNEDLTRQRDATSRQIGLDTLAETARHNQQVELQARDNLAETYRNNVAQLAELQRSHLTNEGIALTNATTAREQHTENVRAHMASEQIALDQLELNKAIAEEAARHNKANEDLSLYSTSSGLRGTEISTAGHVQAAGISAAATQYASDQSLLARQLEIDAQRYGIDVNAGLRNAEISEVSRSNIAREAETNRANVASENIRGATLIENARNNLVNNVQTAFKTAVDLNLRKEANSISRENVAVQRSKAQVDIDLAPSQKFGNYARGASGIVDAIGSAVQSISKLKGGK